jgi:hypothetical protein
MLSKNSKTLHRLNAITAARISMKTSLAKFYLQFNQQKKTEIDALVDIFTL